jgi:hypothetical protein
MQREYYTGVYRFTVGAKAMTEFAADYEIVAKKEKS